MMYRNIIINGLAMIALAVIDSTLMGSLPFGLYRFHLFPIALVFVLLLSNLRVASWWVLGGGLVLEIFSFRPFGAYLFLLFFTLVVIEFLLDKFITNRSVYSIIIITVVVTLIWDIAFFISDYRAGIASFSFNYWIRVIPWSLVINIIGAGIIFYIINALSKRLRPVFLSFKE